MKKVLLTLSFLASITAFGQNISTENPIKAESLSAKEAKSLKAEMAAKAAQRNVAAKTQGGLVSQRMSHADIADVLYSASIQAVFTPFAPDSNYVQDFGSGPDNINVHGFGQTFDPTSVGFALVGQQYFATTDAYTIDTVYVGIRYRTSSSVSGLTGDTLRVAIFTGDVNDDNTWRVGIGYPANTFPSQPARINILAPRYTGNATIGVQGDVNSPNKVIVKYALKASDTAISYLKIVPPAPIQAAAGEKTGVFCTFKPGYTYDPLTQTYYVSGGKGDVNNMGWLYLNATSASDNTPYFFEELNLQSPSSALSNILFSNTRYNAWTGSDAFRNEYVSPSTLSGNLIDFWVTGTSTIGLAENTPNIDVELYPNPTSGIVNIAITQGGTYTIELVNMLGQVVHAEEVSVSGNEKLSRNFSNLTKGIYLVNVKGDNYSSTSKLTINK